MEENKTTNEPITVLMVITGILLVMCSIYYYGIRPGTVKDRCKEESQIKTKERFSNDDLIKDNSTLQNRLRNIKYSNCLVQHGINSSF